MTLERFHQIIEAYGADPRRWPGAERAAASAFAAGDAQARAALIEADRLDGALDAWSAPDASAALRARVLTSAPRPSAPLLFGPWLAGLGATLAAACAAGVVCGVYLAEPALKTAREDAAILSAVRNLGGDASVTAPPRATDEGEAG